MKMLIYPPYQGVGMPWRRVYIPSRRRSYGRRSYRRRRSYGGRY